LVSKAAAAAGHRRIVRVPILYLKNGNSNSGVSSNMTSTSTASSSSLNQPQHSDHQLQLPGNSSGKQQANYSGGNNDKTSPLLVIPSTAATTKRE
jgi:hypothetical protein